jgi:hypothetical protein
MSDTEGVRKEIRKIMTEVVQENTDGTRLTKTIGESKVEELAALVERARRELAEEIKSEIANQLDMVKIVPKEPAKEKEAEIMHAIMVRIYQEPVDIALGRLSGEVK